MVVSVESARTSTAPRGQAPDDWAISARTAWVVVGAFSIVALILSCIDLTARSLSLDEGTTWQVAWVPNSHLLAGISGQGANMALYYVVLHFFMATFGTSVLALRLPSVIAAVSLVPVTYLIGTRFSMRVAVMASGLGAVSLPIVLWAQNARAYTLGTALVALSVLFLLRAMERDHWLDWALWALSASMAVYSLTVAMLVIFAELVAVLLRPRASTPWRHLGTATAALVASGTWMAWVVLGVGHTPGISWLASSVSSSHHPSQLAGLVATLSSAQAEGFYLNGVGRTLVVLTGLLWIAAVAPALFQFLRRGRSETSWKVGLLVLWLALPLLLGVVAPPIVHVFFQQISKNSLIIDRYYLVGVPAGTLLAAIGLTRIRWPVAAVGGAGALIALRLIVLAPTYGVSLDQFAEPTHFVLAHSSPGDCIAFRAAGPRVNYAYYVLHTPHSAPAPQLVLPPEPAPTDAIDLSHQLYQSGLPFWAVPPATVVKSGLVTCRRLWFFEWGVRGSTIPGQPALVGNVANVSALVKAFNARYPHHKEFDFSGTTLTLFQPR